MQCTHDLELEEGGESVTDAHSVSIARPVVRHVVNCHGNVSKQEFRAVDSVLRKKPRRNKTGKRTGQVSSIFHLADNIKQTL